MKDLYSAVAVLDFYFPGTFQAHFKNNLRLHREKRNKIRNKLGLSWAKLSFSLASIKLSLD